ncbi:hypothetical protein I4U23_008813 [Adineta vaga]|nr:hypothetical protein I4U23_008813 [Adineta vaga]
MYSNIDDYDSISQDASSLSDSSSVPTNIKIKHGRSICAICGAKSAGINFDVLTCSSCKAFFRRNGVKPLHQFICRSSGDCKIDERSRRQCTACRLRKCFAMGMIKERIRTEEQNQRHRALVEENRRQKFKKYHQQENRLVCQERHVQQMYSSSCTCENHVDLIFEMFIESTREIISDNFILEFNHDITDGLNQYCVPVSCLITFFKQLSEFQQLPVDDRLILLKNNTKILLPILIHLLTTTLSTQIFCNHSGLHNINNKISYISSLLNYIIPDDNKLLVLLIIVFLFCPCLYTSNSLQDAGHMNEHSRQIIQYAYDEYIQLVWFYMIEKFDDNQQQTTLTYMKIVTTFLRIQNLISEIYDIIECSVQIDQLHLMMQSVLHLT